MLTPRKKGFRKKGSNGKESACSAGDPSSVPGSGRPPRGGTAAHSRTLAWRIFMDRGAWWPQSMGLQIQTRLSDFHLPKKISL